MKTEINPTNEFFANQELEYKRQNQNCVVFITHKITEGILKYLVFLKKEINETMDFVILYDCASQPINIESYPMLDFCIFDSTALDGFFHQHHKLLPNTLVALIECAKQYRYEHYLLMENDIILNGDFNFFIKQINAESNVDYIHIASDVEGSPQSHWPIKFIRNSPFKNLYFSWSQMFYISYRFLTELDVFMKTNDSFHFEFLMPTIAYNRNFVVRQFENYGYQFQLSWGPVELYEYKYKREKYEKTFYHPIKDLNLVDFLQNIKI